MGRICETGRRAWHLATVRLTARPVQVGLSVLGAVFIVALFTVAKSHGYDLYAYGTIDLADPYRLVGAADLSGQGSFRYAPPIALLMAPLGVLPWEVLVVAWLAAQLAAIWSIRGGLPPPSRRKSASDPSWSGRSTISTRSAGSRSSTRAVTDRDPKPRHSVRARRAVDILMMGLHALMRANDDQDR